MLRILSRGIFYITWPASWLRIWGSSRARIVIRYGDDVLFVLPRIGVGKWQLPGGGIRRGESAQVAAIREVREELRLELNIDALKLVGRQEIVEDAIPYNATLLHYDYQQRPTVKLQRFESSAFCLMSLDDALRRSDVSFASKTLLRLAH